MQELKQLRIKKGMTQQQLADRLGVDRTTVTLWELGINKPRADMLIKISNTFNCSVDDLLYPKKYYNIT